MVLHLHTASKGKDRSCSRKHEDQHRQSTLGTVRLPGMDIKSSDPASAVLGVKSSQTFVLVLSYSGPAGDKASCRTLLNSSERKFLSFLAAWCRAKRQAGGLKRELAAKMPSKDAHSPGSISKFDARAPHATRSPWPGKHLRVVVVPPFQDAEVHFCLLLLF